MSCVSRDINGCTTHEMKPQIIAEAAMRVITLACEGARAVSIPIWIPNELRLAKPQSAYDAMVKARGESGFELAWMAESSEVRDLNKL